MPYLVEYFQFLSRMSASLYSTNTKICVSLCIFWWYMVKGNFIVHDTSHKLLGSANIHKTSYDAFITQTSSEGLLSSDSKYTIHPMLFSNFKEPIKSTAYLITDTNGLKINLQV